MLLTFIIRLLVFSHPHSFIPGLNFSFSANPTHLPFLLRGFPGLFADTSKHERFLLFSFFPFSSFSSCFRAVDYADLCQVLSAR